MRIERGQILAWAVEIAVALVLMALAGGVAIAIVVGFLRLIHVL